MSEIATRARRRHRFAWLLVLIGGIAAYLIVLRTLVATQNPLYVPSLLLLGSAVVPASVLVYAASGRERTPVGAGVIAAVAGIGECSVRWRPEPWSTTPCNASARFR